MARGNGLVHSLNIKENWLVSFFPFRKGASVSSRCFGWGETQNGWRVRKREWASLFFNDRDNDPPRRYRWDTSNSCYISRWRISLFSHFSQKAKIENSDRPLTRRSRFFFFFPFSPPFLISWFQSIIKEADDRNVDNVTWLLALKWLSHKRLSGELWPTYLTQWLRKHFFFPHFFAPLKKTKWQ